MKIMRETQNFLKGFLRFLNKVSYVYIALVFVFIFLCVVYFIFVRTPRFLFEIKNNLIESAPLMAQIGGDNGYHIYYSDEEAELGKEFFVRVNGKCPGASVTIKGIYTDKGHTVSDTTLIRCK